MHEVYAFYKPDEMTKLGHYKIDLDFPERTPGHGLGNHPMKGISQLVRKVLHYINLIQFTEFKMPRSMEKFNGDIP